MDPSEGGKEETLTHQYIRYENGAVPTIDARKLAVYVLNRYSNRSQSLKQYSGKVLTITPNDGEPAREVKFDDIVRHIKETRSFDYEVLNLTPLASDLLDSTAIQHNAPAGVGFTMDTNIPNFPILPTLESEGALFTSFQTPIQTNILRLHRSLVANSGKIVNQDILEWVNDLRMLLNECISLVEITLYQMYFAAEYKVRPNWTFDADALGSRYGTRTSDKFKWIGKITGKPLNDADDEVRAFKFLKDIRNHFNHFDPPCVVISVDDAADWLNRIPKIGRLMWKIRSKLDAQLTRELVEMILLPSVAVHPFIQMTGSRPSQRKGAGYSSSVW